MFIADNITVNAEGKLAFAGLDTVELASKYGTPLYLMDEDKIRRRCREYKKAVDGCFREAHILYASKACSFVEIYKIMREENMCIDVVSAGELYTANKAGFPMDRAYFHGNNKTPDEIELAVKLGIGYFIVDNLYELENVNDIAGRYNKKQKILLRITPGIDPHTFEAVATGKVDSKFGSAIVTGQAKEIVEAALKCENVSLEGIHCHIGSQVFDHVLFCDSAKVMIEFMGEIKKETGYELSVLNLGGGFGIRYLDDDPVPDIGRCIKAISETVKSECIKNNIPEPAVLFEPGRSIVADSGMTLYTVGSVKEIEGYKNYVAIDGGMSDNPRYALYESPYTLTIANKAEEDKDYYCSVVGKCCESGDIIQENIHLQTPSPGDVLAVLCTGAYNYSMASNYNKIPRPPVVMVSDKQSRVVVKRETFEDLIKNEIV